MASLINRSRSRSEMILPVANSPTSTKSCGVVVGYGAVVTISLVLLGGGTLLAVQRSAREPAVAASTSSSNLDAATDEIKL